MKDVKSTTLNPVPWSPLEDKIIEKLYPYAPREKLCKILRIRTWQAIKTRAAALGVRRMVGKWTPEMEEYLREHYATESAEVLVKHLKKSWKAIKGKAAQMGLRRQALNSAFLNEYLESLKEAVEF